ncbi:MAG: FHA domain-containing protein [Bacteroidales bacterium]|nr:FHA domain-containing protein [Bacteroidales bacterium]
MMYAYLIYETRVLPVNGDVATIGRKLDNTIVLSSKAVSRYHAEVLLTDGEYYLQDLNSSSGTFLNERRIAHPSLMKSGDFIRIADINLEFVLSDEDLDTHTKKRTSPLKPDS